MIPQLLDKRANKKEKIDFCSFKNMRQLFLLILCVLLIRWSILAPYHVPTSSMAPSIQAGDRILTFKAAYNLRLPFTSIPLISTGLVKRGDIIVFSLPKDPEIIYLKRVIGLEGDRIKIVKNQVFVNGSPLTLTLDQQNHSIIEHTETNPKIFDLYREGEGTSSYWVTHFVAQAQQYAHGDSDWPTDGEHIVGDHCVFVLGDNRDRSQDSRFWGDIPLESIQGQGKYILWSLDNRENSFFSSIRWERLLRRVDYAR